MQKSDVAFAILSSYALNMPWIYEFFDRSVPVIMVAQPDETGRASLKNVLPNWVRTTPALRGGRGCMHMKVSYPASDSSDALNKHLAVYVGKIRTDCLLWNELTFPAAILQERPTARGSVNRQPHSLRLSRYGKRNFCLHTHSHPGLSGTADCLATGHTATVTTYSTRPQSHR